MEPTLVQIPNLGSHQMELINPYVAKKMQFSALGQVQTQIFCIPHKQGF